MDANTSSAGLMWPATFPGSENVEDPHCTTVYLGKVDEQPHSALALLLVSNDFLDAPGDVRVTGVEVFGGGEDDKVWVATLDDTRLGPLRAKIKAAIERYSFKDGSSFPDYRPHVTLSKYEGDDSRPTAPQRIHLGQLEAWWGPDHISW